jgi:hypothetical protein
LLKLEEKAEKKQLAKKVRRIVQAGKEQEEVKREEENANSMFTFPYCF